MPPNSDWLARGGTYYVLAFIWLVSAGFYYYLAIKLGHSSGSPNDGCLIGICNILMAFFGGGVGFLALLHHYPYFILSSIFGSLLFPGLTTVFFASRSRTGR